MTPAAPQAELILDTRRQSPAPGMRSGRSLEHRVLFATPGAYIELLIPKSGDADDAEETWIVGQFLARAEEAELDTDRYTLTVEEASGTTHRVWAGRNGEFLLPVAPGRSFDVTCQGPEGPGARFHFQGGDSEGAREGQ